MLKVASFDISDAKGINETLAKYRIAKGAHILVSDGKVCIPYEDGEPDPKELQINSQKELMFGVIREREVVEQANRSVLAEMADIRDDINTAKGGLAGLENKYSDKKERYDVKRDLEAKLSFFERKMQEKETQDLLNKREIARLNINIGVYEDIIDELSK